MKNLRINVITILIITLLFSIPTAALAQSDAFGAVKKPARPVITSAKITENTVQLKWKKADRAKTYRLFVQTGKDGWKYWKSVKATAKNKKSYSDTLKYKLKKSGKKYKIYKRIHPYKRVVKSTKKLTYTFKGSFGKTYRFAVQAVNGKLASKYSKKKLVRIPQQELKPEDDPQPKDPLAEPKPENVDLIKAYAQKLYNENIMDDYTAGGFTWDQEKRTYSWLYYNGLMLEALLMDDFDNHHEMVKTFYNQHINDDGSIKKYGGYLLDAVMPVVGMEHLVDSGVLTEDETARYQAAIQYTYSMLEHQIVYPEAGNLQQHAQNGNGTLPKAWSRWNICLDGIYMSQLYLVRLTELIDSGKITIKDKDGNIVTSNDIWPDIYSRMMFVMENMRDADSGLPHHGFCVAEQTTNGVSWARGIGWYSMVFLEAAEKMPDSEKREALTAQFASLMDSLIEWQDPETHLWYNVPDHREEVTDNIIETSGSAMFTYCLLRGYHDGLLKDEAYRKAGLRAFNSLAETKLTEDGLVDTMKSSGVTSDINRYAVNKYVINEAKGVAPLIMAAQYAY